jgi:putative N6-adenine-specific DNA methylase
MLALPWNQFIDRNKQLPDFCFHTSSFDSALYHEKAIEERTISSLASYFKQEIVAKPKIDALTQLVVIHVKKNNFTIRLDTTGIHLHKRGFNKFTEAAPLRETIAAAMIYASRAVKDNLSLMDPMCGSGTIPIEAALLKNKVLWDSFRRFRFEYWPAFSTDLMSKAKQSICFPDYSFQEILASDADEKAIKTAVQNAQKAGLEDMISFHCSDIASYQPSQTGGFSALFNPPWGKRLSVSDRLYQDIFRFGNQTAESIIISPHLYAKQGNALFSVKSGDIKLHCQRL